MLAGPPRWRTLLFGWEVMARNLGTIRVYLGWMGTARLGVAAARAEGSGVVLAAVWWHAVKSLSGGSCVAMQKKCELA